VKKFVRFIARKWIYGYDNIHNQEVRSKYGLLEGWVSIIVNFLLFIAKSILGILTGSISLIADSFHTLSDVSTSLVIVVSFRMAKKPSDATHPFGHGRIEAIATVVVAILLSVAGIEIIKSAAGRLLHPRNFEASWWIIGIIAFTILIKEFLARFAREIGKLIQSHTIQADFWHHRTDALSSILVILAFVGHRFGVLYLDGAAGILVGGMIIYTGWEIARKGVDDLLGTQPSEELVQSVKKTVRAFPEVLDVHDLIVHQYGQKMVLSFDIEVSEDLSLKSAHAIAERVEKTINKKFNTHTTVHLDPVNINDPEIKKLHNFLNKLLNQYDEVVSFHDLRIVDKKGTKDIFFNLVLNPEVKDKEAEDLKLKIKDALLNTFPSVNNVILEIEPKYAL